MIGIFSQRVKIIGYSSIGNLGHASPGLILQPPGSLSLNKSSRDTVRNLLYCMLGNLGGANFHESREALSFKSNRAITSPTYHSCSVMHS